MVGAVGWLLPAVILLLLTGFTYFWNASPAVERGLLTGSALAALQAWISTAAVKFSVDKQIFWAVWVASVFARFAFAVTTAYVVYFHSRLNFVATMASLVGFTTLFLVVESATCLKKG